MKKWNKKRIKNLLFGFRGTAIHCPYCKSLNIGFEASDVVDNVESYKVKCEECGSWGNIQETWYQDDEQPSSTTKVKKFKFTSYKFIHGCEMYPGMEFNISEYDGVEYVMDGIYALFQVDSKMARECGEIVERLW